MGRPYLTRQVDLGNNKISFFAWSYVLLSSCDAKAETFGVGCIDGNASLLRLRLKLLMDSVKDEDDLTFAPLRESLCCQLTKGRLSPTLAT